MMSLQVRNAMRVLRDYVDQECAELVELAKEERKGMGSVERATAVVLSRMDRKKYRTLKRLTIAFGKELPPEFDQITYTSLFWTVCDQAKAVKLPGDSCRRR